MGPVLPLPLQQSSPPAGELVTDPNNPYALELTVDDVSAQQPVHTLLPLGLRGVGVSLCAATTPLNPARTLMALQIVGMIGDMPVDSALTFLKAHVAPVNYPNVCMHMRGCGE